MKKYLENLSKGNLTSYLAPLIITIVLIVSVSFMYFTSQNYLEQKFYSDVKFKTSTLNGDLKVFAYSTTIPGNINEGNSLFSQKDNYFGIVLGSAEAKMMRDENLFANTGDTINNFFGINIAISGILSPTGTIIDDMHFLDYEGFNNLDGQNNLYVKFSPEGMPKIFYYKPIDSDFIFKSKLSEGSLSNYKMTVINGDRYYPVIIGYDEAKMMRDEGLFVEVGDTITDFFGYNVVIVGVYEKSGTALDMIHIVPFN